ncbi:ABC transporter substrate-binding protein [Phreatobacter stygius]|uniref:ABC transporter substrate-binding protein n=1 Tax=Phreatobacter stygius TaxID=1940610 RepID=A0A4D7AW52_9HYPH|nr:ABC transporter substrate-binding protein [Phreatobacter stygius]QCI65894.1 ABC transporter substrate-binding protein [Phreatobacter stygius]
MTTLRGGLKTALLAAAVGLLASSMAALPALAQSVLRVRPFGDLKTIDPMVTSDYMVRNHAYMVYDTLFAQDEHGAIKPQMVDRFTTSADGLTWTFVLRDGLKFHDGAAVTSADVVASLKRWGERDGLGQQLLAHTASLTATDPKTITLVLKDRWGLVLDALGKPSSMLPVIMPERLAQTPSNQPITDPTGSGPFMMVRAEWSPGAKIVYIRAPTYVPRAEPPSGLAGAKRANVDRVEWLVIPDAQTALNALQAGEIDIFEEMPPDMLSLVKNNPRIAVARLSALQGVMRFNQLQPPFNNPKLRQAILRLVDQEQTLRAYVDDKSLYTNCPSFYMCDSPYFTNAGWRGPDVAAARQMVRDSGYDGTKIVVLDATETALSPATQVVAQAMREIGLNVDYQAMDWGTLSSRRTSKNPVGQGGWSVFMSGPASPDMAEPVGHLALRSNCDAAWFGWPCDEAIEKLRAAFTMVPDLEGRRAIARQIQERALETVPYVPVGQFWLVRAHQASLTGLIAAGLPVYWNVGKPR